MTEQTRKIDGTSLFGDERKYTFNLMNARTGLEVFHETVSGLMKLSKDIMSLVPALTKLAKDEKKKKDSDKQEIKVSKELMELVEIIPDLLPFKKVIYLAEKILPGCVVEIDGERHVTPDDGVGEYVADDPLELYTALFHGLLANYPKLIAPLAASLGSQESDSSQEK